MAATLPPSESDYCFSLGRVSQSIRRRLRDGSDLDIHYLFPESTSYDNLLLRKERTMRNFDQDRIKALYNKLRSTPLKEFKTREVVASVDAALLEDPRFAKLPSEERTRRMQGYYLFARAAHESSEDVFVQSLTAGEIPPIKLTSQEQEFLRGGTDSWMMELIAGVVIKVFG